MIFHRRIPGRCAALVLAGLCVPGAGYAAPVQLEDVVQGALKGGPSVQRDDERVQRAAGQLQEAQGAFDWNATAETGLETLYVARANSSGVLTNDAETIEAWHTTLGVSRLFRNGIQIEPGVSFYADTAATAAQTQGVTKPRPALNLSIPLLRGFGENNEAAANERAATANLEGNKLGRNFTAQRNVFDAVQTYWRCVATRQHMEVRAAGQDKADGDVTSLRQQVMRGEAEPTVLDRALARQAVQHVNLAKAVAEDQHCRRDLAAFLDPAPDGSLPEATGDFPPLEGMAAAAGRLNEQALVMAALSQRQDLQAMARYQAAEDEKVRGADDSTQPKVDLYIDTTRVLVRLSKSLGNDLARGRQAEAVAGRGEARLNFEQLQNQIRLDIADQLRNLREALANWAALNQSVQLLQGVVEDGARRVQAGVITTQDYRQMQDELAEARDQVIDAKLQYVSGLAGLRLAAGTVETEGASPGGLAALFRSLPET